MTFNDIAYCCMCEECRRLEDVISKLTDCGEFDPEDMPCGECIKCLKAQLKIASEG